MPEHVRDGAFGKWLEGAPRLVDQPQPLLGRADPGVEERRPGLPARSTCTAASTSSSATSACGPTDLHRPVHRRAHAAEPRRPHRASRRCAASTEVLDCWFESGSMPFAQVHYPFENQEWFEHALPGRLHRRVRRRRRAAGSTRCTCCRRRCSTGPRSQTCIVHGVVLDDDGRKLSKRSRNYPDPVEVVRDHRLRRAALVLHVVADPARRRPRRRPTAPWSDAVAAHAQPDLERLVLLHALRQRRRHTAADAAHRRDRRARPLRPGQDPPSWSRRSPTGMDAYDLAGACDGARARSSTR